MPKKREKIEAATVAKTQIKLVFSNELPKGLNPNSVLSPKEMQAHFNYSIRTLGNYRTYYEQDQQIKVGPKWIRVGVKGIKYVVKDVIRSHEGLPWSEPYPQTFDSVNPSKNKND
nr:hypothetical protein [uncultured Mediterranean phage uvMED]